MKRALKPKASAAYEERTSQTENLISSSCSHIGFKLLCIPMSELDSNSKAKNKVYRKTYIPLESDPEIFTSLIHKIGVSSNLEFVDIFSLDESDLTLVPHPVFALILAFPDTDLYHKQIDQSEIGRPDYAGSGDGEDAVWFQQTIHNACGLYGILHAVSNGRARSFVGKLIIDSQDLLSSSH